MSSPSALERIIQPAQGTLPTSVAEYLLGLDFSADDHAKYEALSEKAQAGVLTSDERKILEDLLIANDVLTILQSKARVSLKRSSPAA